jgi:hypothetical protein
LSELTWPRVGQRADGRFGWRLCSVCGGSVFSCPDPACVGLIHHWARDGCPHQNVPEDQVVWRELTLDEVRQYRKALRDLRQQQGQPEDLDDQRFAAYQGLL